MTCYRAYILEKDGHILSALDLDSPSDEAAGELARQFVDGRDVELWQGSRMVAKLKAELEVNDQDDPLDPR